MSLSPITFPTLGWQVIDWIEEYLPHGPGDIQGDDWEIDDEFAAFICHRYRVYPEDHELAGRILVRRAVLSRPKGRAKSELAGGIVCAEALGPVRCDGFDARGDPVGIPVRYPFIRCMATEEDQAGNTYDNVYFMLSEGAVGNEYKVDPGLTRTFIKEPGGGEIVPSTAADASKEGGKETFTVFDETHLYNTNKLRGAYRTVSRNTGKRKKAEPWVLETTTAWQPGENSVAEMVADRYSHLEVEEAVQKHGVLYDHRMGDEPKIFGSDDSLAKAIRTGYGPAAEWIDTKRIVKIVREAEDPLEEAYRYWLNRPRAAASHWLAPYEIQAVIKPEVVISKGQKVAAGFDGSLTDDHTTLWICTADAHMQPVGIWAPQEGQEDGWEVDRPDVARAVHWMFEQFDVVRLDCDPAWWQSEVGEWAEQHGSPPVVEWWTNQDRKMAVATGAFRTDLRREEITFDPMPLLTDPQTRNGKPLAVWHLENTRTKKVRINIDEKTEEAWLVRKERPQSHLKIDSSVAMILAYRARLEALEELMAPPHRVASWQ